MLSVENYVRVTLFSVIFFILSSSTSFASSFFEEVGDWYNKITNPISWMIDANINPTGILATIPIDPPLRAKDKFDAERLPYHVFRDYYAAFDDIKDYAGAHNNFLLNILTFGNDESQHNLNVAYRMGNSINQYHFFVYSRDDWFYLPAHLDAGAVLMYGVNYVVNIPQRALTKIDALWDGKVISYYDADFFMRLFLMLDIVISTFAQIFEIFFAFWGTIIGMVIALICHPLNSICSLFGILYFVVSMAWSAVGGAVISVFGIIGNFF